MLLRSVGPIILSAMVCMSAVAATPSKSAFDADRAQAEAAHFLQELIRIDTSNPPGNESRVAAYAGLPEGGRSRTAERGHDYQLAGIC